MSVMDAPTGRPPRLQEAASGLSARTRSMPRFLLVALGACCVRAGPAFSTVGGGRGGGLGFLPAPGTFLPMLGGPAARSMLGQKPASRLFLGVGGDMGAVRGRGAAGAICMSKKDQRYSLTKRGQSEDDLLLTVAEQFNRREGQAQISWYPGHIAKAEKRLQQVSPTTLPQSSLHIVAQFPVPSSRLLVLSLSLPGVYSAASFY